MDNVPEYRSPYGTIQKQELRKNTEELFFRQYAVPHAPKSYLIKEPDRVRPIHMRCT
jgi:hypothetical protein